MIAPSEPHLTPSLELAQIAEFIEGLSWEDHFLAAPYFLLNEFGPLVDHLSTAIRLGFPANYDPFYNRLIGLGLYEIAHQAMLDELLAYIYHNDLNAFTVHVCPFTQPAQVHDWLRWRGFWLQERHAKFIRDHRPASPPTGDLSSDLRIELTGPDYAAAFAYVALHAFNLPDYLYDWLGNEVGREGWLHYVAWDGEQPVACGAMFIRDEVAWLGHGGTLPQARRRGAQTALLNRRIHDGRELGCRWFVTETGEDLPWRENPSYRNIQRSGFQLAYLRDSYIFHPGTS